MHDYGRHSWLFAASPYDTIRSYSAEAARRLREAASQAGAQLYSERCELPYEIFFDCLPREHVEFFEGLRRYNRTADCLCTHGGLDPLVPRLEDQTPHALIWGTSTFPAGYEGSEIVVYGHRNNAELNGEGWPVPRVVGRTIGIDTIKHCVLTAIRLPDGRLFQSARHDVAEPDA
jgi:hypothetical protein